MTAELGSVNREMFDDQDLFAGAWFNFGSVLLEIIKGEEKKGLDPFTRRRLEAAERYERRLTADEQESRAARIDLHVDAIHEAQETYEAIIGGDWLDGNSEQDRLIYLRSLSIKLDVLASKGVNVARFWADIEDEGLRAYYLANLKAARDLLDAAIAGAPHP